MMAGCRAALVLSRMKADLSSSCRPALPEGRGAAGGRAGRQQAGTLQTVSPPRRASRSPQPEASDTSPGSLVQLHLKPESQSPKAQLQTGAEVKAPAGGVCRVRGSEGDRLGE